MTPRLFTALLIGALLWIATPGLLSLAGHEPVVLRSPDSLALAWFLAAGSTLAAACALTGYGKRHTPIFLSWISFAFLLILPASYPYPLIFIEAHEPLSLWWFATALAGSALLLLWVGRLARHHDDERAQLMTLLTLVDQTLGSGLALFDKKMRLRWSNTTARRYLDSESERLARQALETQHIISQSYSLDETTRLNVQAVPLEGAFVGVATAPLRHETDQFYERFIRRIVHDMRNPLAGILSHATNLRGAPVMDEASIATIEREAQRLSRLVDSILFDARLAYVPLAIEQIDLVDVIEEVQYQYDERASREGKSLQIEAFSDSAPIGADRDLLVRALGNLVDNSLKYSESGAKVTVMLAEMPAQYIIKVIDNGDGIPPDYLPDRIFEALVRARPKEGGSGLGLAIVKKIVEMHKGTIAVESTLRKGTTFTICLPKSPFSSSL